MMTFFFNGAGFEIENSSSMLWFSGAQLFANFFGVVGMDLSVECRAVPIALGIIENRSDRVRNVNNSAGIAADDE